MDVTVFENKFKDIIYAPYTQAWQIIKTLKEADLSKESTWNEYNAKCVDFAKKYGNTEIGSSIHRVMLDAGSEARRILNEM